MKLFVTSALLAGFAIQTPLPAQQAPDSPPAAWRDGGTCYELFIRSFSDSDGDGIGDIRGLIQRLDYINDGNPATTTDLGARCIWLMPMNASPTYHGYDISDYYRVGPEYGSNEDFREFMAAAHARGIRVLYDLVLNHASSEHPAFKDALLNPDSPYREWFRWRDTPGPDNEFGDNNWRRSPVRDEYYYGFFWFSMPDWNWEHESTREEARRIARFWLEEMDVDGFRFDAIRHLMEGADGRSANVPATNDALREYAAFIRNIAPNAFTIGEVWDDNDVLMAYYPDQLDSYFSFELSDRILDAVQTGSGAALVNSVMRLQESVPNHRWAPFLRNHDQVRTLTYLGGDLARAKLAAQILLTLPGIPFVYYGEELGMIGDKPDPRIRAPMHWNLERAAGFTSGLPWEPLQADSLTANVAVLEDDPNSLLNQHRQLIHLRAAEPSLADGDLVPLETETAGILAYLRVAEGHVALIIANLTEAPLVDVELSSDGNVLPRGRYDPVTLFGAVTEAARLRIGGGGRIDDYEPLQELAPLQTYIFRIR